MSNVLHQFSSYNYFESLFLNSKENNIILMDEDGTVLMTNDAFNTSFGYDPEDIIGKNVSIFFTDVDRMKGEPEKEIYRVLTTGQAFDNNYLVSKDKSITWVSGESILVKNDKGDSHILKIIQNIHNQKTSEISLQHLNVFNESILSSIEDVVLVLDASMDIIKANRSFFTIFNPGTEEYKQINFKDIVCTHDGCRGLLNRIENTIEHKKGFTNVAIEIETADCEQKIFDVSCSPLPQYNKSNNLLIVIHDITVHKQVEREREDVIGFVAHELRNPLANIVLCHDMMSEAISENNKIEMRDLLERSKSNISRLNKMIAELYDATRINSGNMKLDVSTFDLDQMIREAIQTVEVLHPSYHIIVKGDKGVKVQGDRYRLIQVVTNFLSNGIKYSNEKPDVVLNVTRDNTFVTVSVKDEGLGISGKQLPYIFDRFFRAEKTKNLEGIGLGLYLCRQIIHAHKGKIWVDSEEAEGSTFYFSLPL